MVGGGAMTREHIKAFRDVPGVEIAGICNRTREKAQALATEYGIPYVASNIADLRAKTNADLAIVAVYETAINPVMREVLAHPWAVLMEKPIGVDLADAESVAAAANNHRVFVGLNRRFLSSTQAVLDDLANDPGPRFVHVQDQQSLDVARQIGHADAVVKNWMFANSIHLVDYLCAFGRGDVVDVTPVERGSRRRSRAWSSPRSRSAPATSGLYEGIWNGPGPWACTVTTPRRRWEMRPLEKAVFQNAGERALNPVEPHAWDGAYKPGARLQAERVVAAVRGGRMQPSRSPRRCVPRALYRPSLRAVTARRICVVTGTRAEYGSCIG